MENEITVAPDLSASSEEKPSTTTEKKKQKRRRAAVQCERPKEMWWNSHGLSLFSRQVKRGDTWYTAPPIEFGPDTRWVDVWGLGFELFGDERHLNGHYLDGRQTAPKEPGSYIATMQNTRDESDTMWKRRLSYDAIARSGWACGGSEDGHKVLMEMLTCSRSEIMREIWRNLDDDERARFPGLLVPVTEGINTETEKWVVEPRAKIWALETPVEAPAESTAQNTPASPILEVEEVGVSSSDIDLDSSDNLQEAVPKSDSNNVHSLEETLNMLLALRHGLMALEVSMRNG